MTEAEIEGVASAIRNASTYTATYPFTVFDPAQPAVVSQFEISQA